QAEDGIRAFHVTGVQTCALPIFPREGASIYPFAWNILLASRHEGFAGTITTLATAREADIQALLGIPSHIAVCAVMPLGRPVRLLSRLKRRPVAEFARRERWDGPSFGTSTAG